MYDRYARMIYAIAWKSLKSVEDCEEVVLDVFAQVWRIADRFDLNKGSPEQWLFTRLGLDPIESATVPQPQIPPPAPELFGIRSQDLQWQPHRVAGVQCASLFVDSVQRMRSMVVKVAAGVTYPLHRHGGIEEIYMLEGELTIDSQTYGAGDYLRSPSGSIHAPSTITGCMFMIRACMDDEYF